MANGFVLPSAVLGLMGRRPPAQQSALGLMGAPVPADEGDEMFLRRQREREEAARLRQQQDQAVLAQAPRERVSGWRLLDRVLGGQTITEGLDSERMRLQGLANVGAGAERNRQILSAIQDPRERALFLASPEDWSKNVGQQFVPQVLAPGAIQAIGGRGVVGNTQQYEQGDERRSYNPLTGEDALVNRRGPTYQEQTARFNAENPTVAANSRVVNLPTGNVIAEGYIEPNVQNVAPGSEALVFDQSGNVINRVGSTQVKPMSDADQKAIAEAEANLARVDNATGRARNIIQQLDAGTLNLNPVGNFVAGIRNATGNSNENSLAIADLKNWAEEARNEILQSANGVQTEGDAIRALNVILSGTNDERIVRQALQRYIDAKAATRVPLERDIARRQSQGQPPASASGPIAQDAQGNRVQWNGSAWVPL